MRAAPFLSVEHRKIAGVRWWILGAAVPAYLSAQSIRADASWYPVTHWLIGLLNLLCIFAWGAIVLCVERAAREGEKPPRRTGLVLSGLIVLVCLPWFLQLLIGMLAEHMGWGLPSEPLELLMMAAIQNGTMAGALIARTPRDGRIVLTLSFFLTLMSVIIAAESQMAAWVLIQAAVYGLIAIWWLMGDYWEGLQDRFVGETDSARLMTRSKHLIATAVVLVLLGSWGYWLAPRGWQLPGWLPTSGGESWSDPTARSGIGDGWMLTSGKDNAHTFGPIESDLFIEDKQPSLYDMVNELNGEVIKKKEMHAAVGIDGSVGKSNHQKLAENDGGEKEFSIVRKVPKRPAPKPANAPSRALVHYIGPAPQRFALATYQAFDGTTWRGEDEATRESSIFDQTEFPLKMDPMGKPWIVVDEEPPPSEAKMTWTASLKWIRLNSPRIPTPDQLHAIHIDRIDRPDFFGWTSDAILEMRDRDQVPPFTVLRMTADHRDLNRWRTLDFQDHGGGDRSSSAQAEAIPSARPGLPSVYYDVASRSEELARLAHQWTNGIPRGWGQIQAIERRLRHDFILDPEAVADEETEDAVGGFLAHRRGPAYLFATTASLLARTLGYPTRLAHGLYVDHRSFDARANHYVLQPEHLHWWPQVSLDGQEWISWEPTPSYESISERWSWQQWSYAIAGGTIRWLRDHLWWVVIGLGLLAGAVRYRVTCLDRLTTAWSLLAIRTSSRFGPRYCLKLLDLRAWLAGNPRPASSSPRQWYLRRLAFSHDDKATLDWLLAIEERRLFAPRHASPAAYDPHRVYRTCRDILNKWSVSSLRRDPLKPHGKS